MKTFSEKYRKAREAWTGRVIDPYGNRACYRYIDASFQCDAFMEKGKHHENEKT